MNYKTMLAPPDYTRAVDIPLEAVKDRLEMGWRVSSAIDERPVLHNTTPGRHKGRNAFVLATGPSASMVNADAIFELVKVRKCVTWVVNDPDRVLKGDPFHGADYLLVLDEQYWSDRRAAFGKYLMANPFCLPVLNFDPPERLFRYQKITIDTATEAGGAGGAGEYIPNHYFYGKSSGIAAIQMAMHAGCGTIYLLGHDCVAHQGRSHSYGVRRPEEVETKDNPRGYPQGARDMLVSYAVLAQHAKQIGVRIVNLSPISALDCFERQTLAQAVKEVL